jgi:hypothetical protein
VLACGITRCPRGRSVRASAKTEITAASMPIRKQAKAATDRPAGLGCIRLYCITRAGRYMWAVHTDGPRARCSTVCVCVCVYAFIMHLSPFFCRAGAQQQQHYLLNVLHTFCTSSRPFQPMHFQSIPDISSARLRSNGYTVKKKSTCP